MSFYGVWGVDSQNVWAAGAHGNAEILRYDGVSWLAQSVPQWEGYPSNLWGTDAAHIWAVNTGGSGFFKWVAGSWEALSGPRQVSSNHTISDVGFYNLWGTDAHNLWFVGVYGEILKFDGDTWTQQASGTMDDLFGVWGTDARNIWAVGGFIFEPPG